MASAVGKDEKLAAGEDLLALPKVKIKARSSRQKSTNENIFAEYGQEHSAASTGGKTAVNSLSVRHHWKSEPDIRRWHQDLNHNSRLDKLLLDVRFESNPDFGTQQAELVQKHNALFRQRSTIQKGRTNSDSKKLLGEIQGMAAAIAPKPKVKKKTAAKSINFQFLDMLSGSLHKVQHADPFLEETEKAVPKQKVFEDNESADHDGDCEDEDAGPSSSSSSIHAGSASHGLDRSADFSLGSDAMSKDPSSQLLGSNSIGVLWPTASPKDLSGKAAKQPHTGAKESLPKVQCQTMTLLLYRNGDRNHNGEVVFIHRAPKTMKELLEKCGEGCRVMVGPADALFDSNMQQMKTVQDVEAGASVFLLKGKELLDPPPAFLASSKPAGGSMKQLTTFRQTWASAPTTKTRTVSSAQHLPSVSAPAFGEGRSGRSSGKEDATWGISDTLSWNLSYGGQIGRWSGRHHDYSMWPRKQALSGRGAGASALRMTQ